MSTTSLFRLWPALLLVLSGCNFLFGSKQDDSVDDVLRQGAIDPNMVREIVGYVPILPTWEGFIDPSDVYVGYDEMVYVVESSPTNSGLWVLDLKGDRQNFIPITGATKVTQDRRMHTYVLGRINLNRDGEIFNLAAVYVLTGTGTREPVFIDTLIHPFNDLSRNNTNFRGVFDEQVEFTGLATTHDNGFYLARRGPTNSLTSTAVPDNAVLVYRPNRTNNGSVRSLNPNTSSLRSSMSLSGLTSFLAPPQLVFGMSNSMDFFMLQSHPSAEYKALWIRQIDNPETGISFIENSSMLNFDTSRADRFLYEGFRFTKPADICIAPDETGYIFIVDSERDSLYQFTRLGFEGVNPPPASGLSKQVIASFGGRGAGPFQFNQPKGVAYFRRVVYVADSGNGRIMRYILSIDLER
ncbi:MAG: hypothetical protein ACK417_02185 [Bacteroidia bacterium]